MSIQITFLRHAETESNAAGLWQGHGDSPITVTGRAQLARLAARMRGRQFDVVVASDLGRTRATAAAIADDYRTDPAWREADLGNWENMARDEIFSKHGHVLAAMRSGEDPPFGETGERLSELSARLGRALRELLDGLGDGGHALVVAHGGVVRGAVASALGKAAPAPLTGPFNTSMTTLRFYGGSGGSTDNGALRGQIAVYNDTSHLSGYVGEEQHTAVILVRHGQSEGNLTGTWQGLVDTPLTALGADQAERAATAIGEIDAVYSSPLSRARHTAEAIAARHGSDVVIDDRLTEFDFGAWEDMTPDQIKAAYPEEWRAMYELGHDLPRGGSGDTFASAAERMRAALTEIVASHQGDRVAVVSHGGVSRAFAATHLGLGFAARYRLGSLENTAISRLPHTGRGFELTSWNLTPHLESA